MDTSPDKDAPAGFDDKITIKTGNAKYSFSGAWTENKDLNKLLVGLIADDLNQITDNR